MDFLYGADLLGTLVFAISGALAVKDDEVDWLGAGFTGFVTAIGGGTLRDVLLNSYPLAWIQDPNLLLVILLGLTLAFAFYNTLERLQKTLLLFDSLGIAFFTILGLQKALSLGVRPEIAAMMGMFSAVMGGVIRDTLTNNLPVIFRKELYASPCLVGAGLYILFAYFQIPPDLNIVIGVVFIVVFRLLSIRFGWSLPRFRRAE
jgi:uncharacterized membrane protein YeiH